MEEIKATVKTKRDLTEEEMEKVNGGCMPTCFHPELSKYLGKSKTRFGERLYLWQCAKCGAEIWVLNVPRTGGAEGGW